MNTELSNKRSPSDSSQLPIQTSDFLSKKHWKMILILVSLIIIIIIVQSRIIKNNLSTFNARNTIPPQTATTTENVLKETSSIIVRDYTIDDVNNSKITQIYLEESNFFIDPLQIIPLTNGIGTFSFCYEKSNCGGEKIQKGTVMVNNITFLEKPIILLDNPYEGISVLTFDFKNGTKESYIGSFNYTNFENRNNFFFGFPADLGTLYGNIDKISINDKEEIEVYIRGLNNELTHRTFILSTTGLTRYFGFAEITGDKKYKIYKNRKIGYSFTYPIQTIINYSQLLRNQEIENESKLSPIFYSEQCGLQQTLADILIRFRSQDPISGLNLSAYLTVHKISSPIVYVIPPADFYDPLDLPKIIKPIAVLNYLNDVKNGTIISEGKVTLENIHGHEVTHIMPFYYKDTCFNSDQEQYQWVIGNLFFNLIIDDQRKEIEHLFHDMKVELINSIFSSLELI